jgi:hypothetical protein
VWNDPVTVRLPDLRKCFEPADSDFPAEHSPPYLPLYISGLGDVALEVEGYQVLVAAVQEAAAIHACALLGSTWRSIARARKP